MPGMDSGSAGDAVVLIYPNICVPGIILAVVL